MNIELTSEETDVLKGILVDEVTKLQVEINRTATHDFKEHLRRRQQVMERMARKLGSLDPVVTRP